ncbi:MAG: thiol:disulfide interchange protein DsbA/DsbL [Gammaproteobacteria bacterium]|nr:thiol:disulfide interchange protein DsbA/DsbL [Gammaproteobacteria bacterium]NNC57475.1 thiol:disulfide interchange protein DsbA/DsbL [Woeseiaceae bacterium]NNL52024.1 thiol:disulfide interchange protein DsbA/DsbL [Woeseiaceae bacterium]
MKYLKLIGPLLLIVGLLGLHACSKEEAAVAPIEEAAVAAEQTADVAQEEAATSADEATSETLEVVEESAAEDAPADEAIVLAVAEPPVAPREWQFKEGQHYARMVPTQPTVGGADKIEVAEFFWYGCPHCYDLEPYIDSWVENKDSNVRFVRVPATWNALVRLHGQLYYTEEVLVRNGVIKDPGGFRESIFQEYHRRGNRMTTEAAIQKLFVRFGVSEAQFKATWDSFEVNQKLRVADDLARRYSIASVPAMVVNGKYRAGAAEAGSYPKLMELVDELVLRESLR